MSYTCATVSSVALVPTATILCTHLLCLCTASDGACECLLVCVWHGAISVSGLSLEGMPLPKH